MRFSLPLALGGRRNCRYTQDMANASSVPMPVPAHQSGVAPPEAAGSGRRSNLNRRDFFALVATQVRAKLPPELTDFRHHANIMLLKIDYGIERVHYEVWADGARQRLELGLHFEDGPASTAAYLAYFDSRIVEIKHHLGVNVELERWTISWGHLFESAPLRALDRNLAQTVASRLAAYITLLQPLVVEANVPIERRDEKSGPRGRWRQRAKR
jgi:hypothetical protein